MMGKHFKLTALILKSMLGIALLAIEGLFWALHGVTQLFQVGTGIVRARGMLMGGALHCPQGHAVPTEGETYQCQRCSFVYQGSVWVCGNPECGAISPYCQCPTCGLSVSNPYRCG